MLLAGPKTSSPSPKSPSPRGIEIVASSANTEFRADAPGPENRGAGGSGRRGLPPYLLEGVPGLGSPFRSTGSNCAFGGGGLLNSEEPLGVQERVGDTRPLGEYELYVLFGGAMLGAVSMIEGARECDDITVGWYDLRGVTGGRLFGSSRDVNSLICDALLMSPIGLFSSP